MKQISKFLSFILRHKPEQIGIQLDHEGWTNIDELIKLSKNDIKLNYQLIKDVVEQNDKKRFQISEDGLNIRAVQGHSTNMVKRELTPIKPPDILYHGTASRFIESIQQNGLIAGSRHHVHLSENKDTSTEVGKRYGKPILLIIDSNSLKASADILDDFIPEASIIDF